MKKTLCLICLVVLALSSFLLITSCSKNNPAAAAGITNAVRIAYVVYVASDDVRLMVMNADGTGNTRVSYTARPEGVGAVASNGLFPYINDVTAGSSTDLTLINSDGTGNTRLTYSGYIHCPDLSKDRSKIVYMKDGNIYAINADGAGGEQLIAAGPSNSPKWSPDGTKILYLNGAGDIGVMDADGSDPEPICADGTTTISVYRAAWSPDGAEIAFTGYDNTINSFGIWKMNADGSGLELLQYYGDIYGVNIIWLSNGRIVFDMENAGTADIYIMDADGKNLTNLTNSMATYDVLDLYGWY